MHHDGQWDIMHLQNESIRTAMPYLIGLYASVEILSVNVGQTGRVTCHRTQRMMWFRVLIPEDKSQAPRWLKLEAKFCPLLYIVLHFFINWFLGCTVEAANGSWIRNTCLVTDDKDNSSQSQIAQTYHRMLVINSYNHQESGNPSPKHLRPSWDIQEAKPWTHWPTWWEERWEVMDGSPMQHK